MDGEDSEGEDHEHRSGYLGSEIRSGVLIDGACKPVKIVNEGDPKSGHILIDGEDYIECACEDSESEGEEGEGEDEIEPKVVPIPDEEVAKKQSEEATLEGEGEDSTPIEEDDDDSINKRPKQINYEEGEGEDDTDSLNKRPVQENYEDEDTD